MLLPMAPWLALAAPRHLVNPCSAWRSEATSHAAGAASGSRRSGRQRLSNSSSACTAALKATWCLGSEEDEQHLPGHIYIFFIVTYGNMNVI